MPADPQQLTPWFEGSVRPVRAGLYERKLLWKQSIELWDGNCWHMKDWDGHWLESNFQPNIDGGSDFCWRGLAKE